MVESVKELKIICRRPNQKNNIYQWIAPYFTKLLLILHINANQTSIIGFELGVIASIFFLFQNPLWYTVGGIFLFFIMVCDCCDGKIARYNKKKPGDLGGFFDWFNHQSKTLIFICLTIGLIQQFSLKQTLLIASFGFIVTLFWFLNHFFSTLRYQLSKLNSSDNYLKDVILKIEKTFGNKFSRIIIKSVFPSRIISKRFRITYIKVRSDRSNTYRVKNALKRSQNDKFLPFYFIISGIVDYFLIKPYTTLFFWFYIGISGILLFITEEHLMQK